MLAALIAVTTFGAAVLCFILAEGLFDTRRAQIAETHCHTEAPVPVMVTVLNGLATGLLLAAAISLLCLLVLLFRYPSERSAVAVPLTAVSSVLAVLFMFGAGYETVRPEPASTGHNPCAFSSR
ncbi:hypothetical protein [Nocardia salmonicida]|uniref:hypothetical protein n=1 Tax=Nocardia salmonicida TaxID=53431 RepID=UPI0007A37FC1|nr:hypothetical protein [Nocardia salmonicida]